MKKIAMQSEDYCIDRGTYRTFPAALDAVIARLNELYPGCWDSIQIQNVTEITRTEFNETVTVAGSAVVVFSYEYDETAENERKKFSENLAAAFR